MKLSGQFKNRTSHILEININFFVLNCLSNILANRIYF